MESPDVNRLNQIHSNDGLVFTDDIQARWTMKGNGAVLELWSEDKGWYTRFKNCQYITARQTPASGNSAW